MIQMICNNLFLNNYFIGNCMTYIPIVSFIIWTKTITYNQDITFFTYYNSNMI